MEDLDLIFCEDSIGCDVEEGSPGWPLADRDCSPAAIEEESWYCKEPTRGFCCWGTAGPALPSIIGPCNVIVRRRGAPCTESVAIVPLSCCRWPLLSDDSRRPIGKRVGILGLPCSFCIGSALGEVGGDDDKDRNSRSNVCVVFGCIMASSPAPGVTQRMVLLFCALLVVSSVVERLDRTCEGLSSLSHWSYRLGSLRGRSCVHRCRFMVRRRGTQMPSANDSNAPVQMSAQISRVDNASKTPSSLIRELTGLG